MFSLSIIDHGLKEDARKTTTKVSPNLLDVLCERQAGFLHLVSGRPLRVQNLDCLEAEAINPLAFLFEARVEDDGADKSTSHSCTSGLFVK
jgi:hypothetical protein